MPRRHRAAENAAVIVLGGTVHIDCVNNTTLVIRGGTVSIDIVNNLFIAPPANESPRDGDDPEEFVFGPGALVENDVSDLGDLVGDEVLGDPEDN